MDSIMGVRRQALAKVLAAFVLAVGLLAAGTNTAYAKHGADDGPRHEHHHGKHHHHGEHGPHHR